MPMFSRDVVCGLSMVTDVKAECGLADDEDNDDETEGTCCAVCPPPKKFCSVEAVRLATHECLEVHVLSKMPSICSLP